MRDDIIHVPYDVRFFVAGSRVLTLYFLFDNIDKLIQSVYTSLNALNIEMLNDTF